MTSPRLRNSREIAVEVFGCHEPRQIMSKIQMLSEQALIYEDTHGAKGIPSKKIGGKRYYDPSWFSLSHDDKLEALERQFRRA